ncbi:hypothetical protein DB345_17295 [Spartobacteria bacterium LR76]|nr:hypothetical protein DB345_17295 [Spartobacteria bacterium LR76]
MRDLKGCWLTVSEHTEYLDNGEWKSLAHYDYATLDLWREALTRGRNKKWRNYVLARELTEAEALRLYCRSEIPAEFQQSLGLDKPAAQELLESVDETVAALRLLSDKLGEMVKLAGWDLPPSLALPSGLGQLAQRISQRLLSAAEAAVDEIGHGETSRNPEPVSPVTLPTE